MYKYFNIRVVPLHGRVRVQASLLACVYMPFGTSLSYVLRARGRQCETSNALAHSSVLGLHADRPPLMNNYLQQCKTKPLIAMRRRGRVSTWLTPQIRPVPRSFVLVRAVQGINDGALFYKRPVGRSLAACSEERFCCTLWFLQNCIKRGIFFPVRAQNGV